jgi:hypothetical protein
MILSFYPKTMPKMKKGRRGDVEMWRRNNTGKNKR